MIIWAVDGIWTHNGISSLCLEGRCQSQIRLRPHEKYIKHRSGLAPDYMRLQLIFSLLWITVHCIYVPHEKLAFSSPVSQTGTLLYELMKGWNKKGTSCEGSFFYFKIFLFILKQYRSLLLFTADPISTTMPK